MIRPAQHVLLGQGRAGTGGPPGIGQPWQGGFYAGNIQYADGRSFHIILADVSATVESAAWGFNGERTYALDDDDGVCNQAVIADLGFEVPGEEAVAFEHCETYSAGGYDDWYMPSNNELLLIHGNLRSNLPGVPAAFAEGGDQEIRSNLYTSTESDLNRAFSIKFPDGQIAERSKSGGLTDTRPVRRVEFDPLPEAGVHRYWRVSFELTRDIGQFRALIAELDFLDEVGGSSLVSGGTAFASTAFSTDFNADKAFDGDPDTSWASDSNAALPQYVGYEFPSAVSPGAIMMQAGNNSDRAARAPLKFILQYSDDGEAWSNAAVFAGEPAWDPSEVRNYAIAA